MANDIERTEPPALPLAPEEYQRPFMDQNSNVLRLFFNRFINSLNNLFSTESGGKFLYMPRGAFYSTQDQTASNVNTGYAVTFNNTVYSSGVTLSNNSRINVQNAGTYKFDVTLQGCTATGYFEILSAALPRNGAAKKWPSTSFPC